MKRRFSNQMPETSKGVAITTTTRRRCCSKEMKRRFSNEMPETSKIIITIHVKIHNYFCLITNLELNLKCVQSNGSSEIAAPFTLREGEWPLTMVCEAHESDVDIGILAVMLLQDVIASLKIREVFHLTAKDGNSHTKLMMLINGKKLSVHSSEPLYVNSSEPLLKPLYVNSSEPITVAPYSIVFVHFPHYPIRLPKLISLLPRTFISPSFYLEHELTS
ncbi:Glycoside hydrolase, catalytic domain-containing protein [Artemisia annua]|uniref:Glycoside hydrolase, catalytic domain-containing protein n=1 Tax=Artemisia annua TaxID=35608 RepID=A0A2U1NZJ5_ARTAN|nr:Glycoside hydrolase, catalytic domain-containing protein [Artemisia annua]